jgi:hypothetical protein
MGRLFRFARCRSFISLSMQDAHGPKTKDLARRMHCSRRGFRFIGISGISARLPCGPGKSKPLWVGPTAEFG